ncbi:Uncharacterised protein [uncultured archaeon]|nr:Uncharacterised protein [uncultured archaeon]
MSQMAAAQVQKATEKLHRAKANGILQRNCNECRKKDNNLQRASIGAAPGIIPPIVNEVLHSSGRPLDASTRAFMEPRFGHDFGKVRVHSDARSGESAQALNARAYTFGHHMVFDNGEYAPQMDTGKRLLAHELAHTIQSVQIIGSANQPRISQTTDAEELAADAAASQVMRGRMPKLTSVTNAPGIYRQQRLILSLPRDKLKALGNRDINAIVDAIPQQVANGQSVVIKRAVVDGVQHIFELAIKINPGGPSITAPEAGRTELEVASRTAQAVNYKIRVELAQQIPDAVMTLYHELIHVQLLIDQNLPEDQQSETYQNFSKVMDMASDPSLLAVTGTTLKRDAVFEKIINLRTWYKMYVFDPANLSLPPALEMSNDEKRYRFLINEYFTNKEANRAFKKDIENSVLARRYARSIQEQFQAAAQGQGLFNSLTQTRAKMKTNDFDITDELTKVLEDLFDALDSQLQAINTFKQAPPSGVPSSPYPGNVDPYPRPVPIGG